jgi:hypothetical protein
VRFEKWQALGNDYVIVEADDLPGPLTAPVVRALCDRHTGIGADGVLLLEPPAGTERAVIRVAVERIADSCGYGVPVMRYEGTRPQYEAWAEAKQRKGGLDEYVAKHNARSIDGLPAVDLEPA